MNLGRERKRVVLRAHGSLADFSPSDHYSFDVSTLAKDAIEGVGIPHSEVDILFLNEKVVDFRARIANGDRLEVFPVGFHPDLYSPVRPPPLSEIRFIVDENSGKLASALRLLGFDTSYSRDYDDPRLAEISDVDNRILLTRDIGLLKRGRVRYGYWIRHSDPRDQIREVIRRFDLWRTRQPLKRCLRCNTLLGGVSRESARPHVPHRVWDRNDEFFRCDSCETVYWKGSHYTKMQDWLTKLEKSLRDERANPTG